MKRALGLVHVADAGHGALVHHPDPQGDVGRPRQPADRFIGVEGVGQQVGTERRDGRVPGEGGG